MQRLRLTEDFALEFGDLLAHPLYSGDDDRRELSSPIHIIKGNLVGNDNIQYVLNADGSDTNNVRETSSIAKNATYNVLLTRTPQCYTDVLMKDFDDCLFVNETDDSAQYVRCKLYTVAGFKWPQGVAGVYLSVSQTVKGVKTVLRNMSLLKSHGSQWQFKPVASKSVVLDNELFTNYIEFDILDLSFVGTNTQNDSITKLRQALFDTEDQIAVNSNIDVEIAWIWEDDVFEFEAPLFGQQNLYDFNQWSAREIKRAPLLVTNASQDLYAKATWIAGSDYSNAHIEFQLAHRKMQLETWIAQQEAVDAVSIQWDVIVQAYNREGNYIDQSSSHTILQSGSNPVMPIAWIPVIRTSDDVDAMPEMTMIFATAVLEMQNGLGDIRLSRSVQILLNKAQLTSMCWLKRPQVSFETHDVIHKVQVNKIEAPATATTSIKERISEIKVPEYIHIKSVIVNDDNVAELGVKTLYCARNATLNVALQLLDESNSLVSTNNAQVAWIAKSSKGIVKDALHIGSSFIEFALVNNEGVSTTWDIMTTTGKQLQRIILDSKS